MSEFAIRALADYVFFRRCEPERKVGELGLIELPDTVAANSMYGICVAAGPDAIDTIRHGQKALIGKKNAQTIRYAGEEFVVMRVADVMAVEPEQGLTEAEIMEIAAKGPSGPIVPHGRTIPYANWPDRRVVFVVTAKNIGDDMLTPLAHEAIRNMLDRDGGNGTLFEYTDPNGIEIEAYPMTTYEPPRADGYAADGV